MIKNLLLWEKWRPRKIEDCALPDRILKNFERGVDKNYIFHGHYGTGKTTLARILIGKWSKDKPFLEINSSLYTSIDVLRSDVEKFCRTVPMFEGTSDIKYVFLDEFERVSPQYQDALKAFVEEYHQNVRFILTTNHPHKISDGIKSRFTSIDFNTLDRVEEKEVKIKIFKRLTEILKNEEISIDKNDLFDLINSKFPDIRSMFVMIQNIKDGVLKNSNEKSNIELKRITFDIIENSKIDYNDIYHFLMENYGDTKIDILFDILGRHFVDYCLLEDKWVDKLFELNFIISDYRDKLSNKSRSYYTRYDNFRKI